MNPYGVNTSETNISAPLVSLHILYEGMPETTGCEKCHEINGDDAIWCCRTQSPSMFYAEFLFIWREVQQWDKDKRFELVLRAIRNYLSNRHDKGCMFYDNECLVYSCRPFVCRMYGVIPTDNWNKRWESLKVRQGPSFEAKPQCDLVDVKDGQTISCEQEDKWFNHTKEVESRIGVPNKAIQMHDEPGGSYRTFHDHLLVEIFPVDFLHMLTQVRMTNPSKDEIDKTIDEIRVQITGEQEIILA